MNKMIAAVLATAFGLSAASVAVAQDAVGQSKAPVRAEAPIEKKEVNKQVDDFAMPTAPQAFWIAGKRIAEVKYRASNSNDVLGGRGELVESAQIAAWATSALKQLGYQVTGDAKDPTVVMETNCSFPVCETTLFVQRDVHVMSSDSVRERSLFLPKRVVAEMSGLAKAPESVMGDKVSTEKKRAGVAQAAINSVKEVLAGFDAAVATAGELAVFKESAPAEKPGKDGGALKLNPVQSLPKMKGDACLIFPKGKQGNTKAVIGARGDGEYDLTINLGGDDLVLASDDETGDDVFFRGGKSPVRVVIPKQDNVEETDSTSIMTTTITVTKGKVKKVIPVEVECGNAS